MRKKCLSLHEATERPSHGAPAFFIRDKHTFVMFADDHHGDGRLAIWCSTPAEMQSMLVESSPEHYFVPAYVGPSGWTGVRLDRDLGWSEIDGVIEAAYQARYDKTKPKGRAPKKAAAAPAEPVKRATARSSDRQSRSSPAAQRRPPPTR